MAPKRSQTKRPKKASVAPKKKGASKITNRRREHARVDEEDGAEVDGVGDEAGEPQSRKEKNAHRFLRFSERIAAIDVDVHHRHAVTSLAERPRQDSFFQASDKSGQIIPISSCVFSHSLSRLTRVMLASVPGFLGEMEGAEFGERIR